MTSQAHRTRSITVVSLHYEGKAVMIRERESKVCNHQMMGNTGYQTRRPRLAGSKASPGRKP